jgi:hypothetical protein
MSLKTLAARDEILYMNMEYGAHIFIDSDNPYCGA